MQQEERAAVRKKCARKRRRRQCLRIVLLTFVLLGALDTTSLAAPVDVIHSLVGGTDSQTLRIILELTLIALVPTLLIMMTGFTRIVIVLSMARNALGLQNTPPNMVIIGLALFLTYFVMSPVLTQVSNTAVEPYIKEEITYQQFSKAAMKPFRSFMFKETYKSDLNYFCELDGIDESTLKNKSSQKSSTSASSGSSTSSSSSKKSTKKTVDTSDSAALAKIPNRVVISAFITSELKHAFAIGLFIYIPFIIIDMVVASTLMAMGMMMLPPTTISMPFKIMLFVLVDGWQLTIGTLIKSF